jgi:alpha-mannosidase
MGFSSVFFARMDYQDYALRKNSSRLEFVWRPSKSLGTASDIFAHQMWDETYCWPDGFNFEGGDQVRRGFS